MKRVFSIKNNTFGTSLSKLTLLFIVFITIFSCMSIVFGNKSSRVSADHVLTKVNFEQSFVGGGGSSGGSSGSGSGSLVGTSTFSGGTGTATNPYKISTRADFESLAQGAKDSESISDAAFGYYNKHFVMTNDIDLAGFSGVPYFTGASFDGAGHKIKNMSATFGLFKHINAYGCSVTIKNIILQSGGISVSQFSGSASSIDVGSLAGFVSTLTYDYDTSSNAFVNKKSNYSVTISNCYNIGVNIAINGSLSAGTAVSAGGLVGCSSGSVTIKNCANYASVFIHSNNTTISGVQSGGIVGVCDGTQIQTCSNNNSVGVFPGSYKIPFSAAGGIAGAAKDSTITKCVNNGDVFASSYASTDNTTIHYAYAGGILAHATSGVTISYCYNTGDVDSNSMTRCDDTTYYINLQKKSYTSVLEDGRTFKTAEYPNVYFYYTYAFSGGIVATEQANLSYCYNLGKVTAPSQTSVYGLFFYIYGFLFESNRFRYSFSFSTYKNNAFPIAPASTSYTRSYLYYSQIMQNDEISYTDHNYVNYQLSSSQYGNNSSYTKTHDLGCKTRSYSVKISQDYASTTPYYTQIYFYIIDNNGDSNNVLVNQGSLSYTNSITSSFYALPGRTYLTFAKIPTSSAGSYSNTIKTISFYKNGQWSSQKYNEVNNGYPFLSEMYW